MSTPGTDAQSPGGKTGPVLSAGLQRTPLPGGGGGGERTLPLPPPRPAPLRAPAQSRAPDGVPVPLRRRARAPEVTYRPGTWTAGRGGVEPSEVSRLWRPGQDGPRRPKPDVVAGVGVWVLIPERWEAAWKPLALRSPRIQLGVSSALKRGRGRWCGSPGCLVLRIAGAPHSKAVFLPTAPAREPHGWVHHLGGDAPGSHL